MNVINTVINCNDKLVLVNLVLMDKCAYVWLSLEGTPPCMSNLVTAIETNYGVLSTSLISVGDDKGSSLAQRLSKRFHMQVLVADTLPELEPEDVRAVEIKLVDELCKAISS